VNRPRLPERPLTYDEIYGDGLDGTAAAMGLTGAGADAADAVVVDVDELLARRNGGDRAALVAPDVDELLARDAPAYDWTVPGLLERADRTILTGAEGVGKSTLLRHIAMAVASGRHPFTFDRIDPVRVLLFECENSERHMIRQLRPLRDAAGDDYRPGHLRIRIAAAGMDLTQHEHAEHFVRLVDANEPQLIVAGPIYKMAGGDPNDEQNAKLVVKVFDRIRAGYGPALLLEAHTPHATNSKARPTRPYGASLWLRWPEFGFHIAKDGRLSHWRGPRDERGWPTRLARGRGGWPWIAAGEPEPAPDPRDALDAYDGPTECMAAIVHHLNQHAPAGFSTRKIADELRALGNGYKTETVSRAAQLAVERGLIGVERGRRGALMYSANPTL
jgi:energy-coupling factor transporter ATP-binding protein EcfA2